MSGPPERVSSLRPLFIAVLHFDELGPRTPQMPPRPLGAFTQLAASAVVHALALVIAASIGTTSDPPIDLRQIGHVTDQSSIDTRHIVFLSPALPRVGGGGGGGGNEHAGPIRRAQGVGSDAITLRTRKPTPVPPAPSGDLSAAVEEMPALPSIVLDAKPLASGILEQIGLPSDGAASIESTGPGSGGGVGSGVGTGIGPGRGAGLGPGAGGGTGGGMYRPGGLVSSPRVIKEVKPTYTNEALFRKIQGTVVIELVVTCDGEPSRIRVVRSLDPGGLDEQAVVAVSHWRFEPGRLAGTPVDVLVTVMLDFSIR